MLEVSAVECVRGERLLFSGLSFTLDAGQLVRVAGANGSGKTSLLRMLCGLLLPTSGSVRWRGADIRTAREEYGRELLYIGHASGIKDDLTARENLQIAATLAGADDAPRRIGDALAALGLARREDLPARLLSQGQRRRVALARLLLSARVPLWLLDEPFTALDAGAVARVQEIVAQHVLGGGMVAYTTHMEAVIASGAAITIDLDARAA